MQSLVTTRVKTELTSKKNVTCIYCHQFNSYTRRLYLMTVVFQKTQNEKTMDIQKLRSLVQGTAPSKVRPDRQSSIASTSGLQKLKSI